MKTISRVFRYAFYFLQAETKELRTEAFQAAQNYYAARPLRTASNPYPRVADYNFRREEFIAFQRAYTNQRCHEIATVKLAETK
jgi:hypothetical protein